MTSQLEALDSLATIQERPLSITIVGWYLIATSALWLCGLLRAPNPIFQEAWGAVGINPASLLISSLVTAVANIVSGAAILRQHGWGRALYLTVGAAGILANTFVYRVAPAGILIAVLSFAIPTYLLFRVPARSYFAGTYVRTEEQRRESRMLVQLRESQRSDNSVRLVFGLLFCLGAGSLFCFMLVAIGMKTINSAVVLLAFLLLPSLVGLAIGAHLWGSRRWKSLAGWTLASSSLPSAITCFSLASMVGTEAFRETMSVSQSPIILSAGQLVLVGVLSILTLAAGALLIDKQYSLDKEAVRLAPSPE